MNTPSSSELGVNSMKRIQSGLGFLLIAFILLIISVVSESSFFTFLSGVVGIVGIWKIRRAVSALQEHCAEWLSVVRGSEGLKGKEVTAYNTQKPLSIEKTVTTLDERVQRSVTHDESIQRHEKKKQGTPHLHQGVDWEQWVGQKLLQKVGILIVLIGMVVFLKYSFDNRLIGELGRIALSVLAAAALLVAGEWFQRKYAVWSHAFTGAGLVLSYFTVWAAHIFYHEALLVHHGLSVSAPMAMGMYSLITLIGAIAAVRYNARTIALFTIFGGYLTPFFIDAPDPNYVSLTIYLAILAAGVLALAWHQKWSYISLIAFLFTQLYLFGLIYHAWSISDTQQTVIAIGFFILFALVPLLFQFRLCRAAEADDIMLIVFDGVATFFAVVLAQGEFWSQYVGVTSLSLAAVYTVFAGFALQKRATDTLLVNTYLFAATALAALAMYAQMTWEWVAAGWAPFSVLLLLVGIRLERKCVFGSAVALLGGAIAFLVLNLPTLTLGREDIWHPFTSHWALLSYVVFSCLLAWVFFSKKLPSTLMPTVESEKKLSPSLHALIAILLFAAITFEVTGLTWVIELPLALSYLTFSFIAIILFVLTRLIIWFIAAFLVQALVILFTFAFAPHSGMIFPGFNDDFVVPFLHPWAGISALSMLATGALLFVIIRKGSYWLNTQYVRRFFIIVASAQLWIHVTIEIFHVQSVFQWQDIFLSRVLSAWWILFSIPYFYRSIRYKRQFVLKAAIIALCIPLIKDIYLMYDGSGDLYEVTLWTVLPLMMMSIASRLKTRELLIVGSVMLASTMAVDMFSTIAHDVGLLRTIWWAVVGLITISLGFMKREQLLRRLAIGIFAATVVKLLVFDFATLSAVVRMFASIMTGLLLIGASYLYQRFDTLVTRPHS